MLHCRTYLYLRLDDNNCCACSVVFFLLCFFGTWISRRLRKTQELKKQHSQKICRNSKDFMDFSDRNFFPKFGLSPHIRIGQSALDSATLDKFLENPSNVPSFGEKDYSKQCWVF